MPREKYLVAAGIDFLKIVCVKKDLEKNPVFLFSKCGNDNPSKTYLRRPSLDGKQRERYPN